MRILTTTQGDDAWEVARKGRITASSIANVLAGKNTKSRREYILQLVLDLEGIEDFRDSAQWFADGRKYEAHARGWYNWEREPVTECGFVLHEHYNWLGASPDGFVGDDGCVEIKYRKWLRTFTDSIAKPIPRLYDYQMQAQMWVCDKQWCDYINYWRDDATGKEQGHIRRVERDEAKIVELENACFVFWEEVLATYQKRTGKTQFQFPRDAARYGRENK